MEQGKKYGLIVLIFILTHGFAFSQNGTLSVTDRAKQAHGFLVSGNLEKALEITNDLIHEKPEEPQFQDWAGYIWAVKGDFNKAVSYFEKERDLLAQSTGSRKKDLADCLVKIGRCHNSLGNPDKAITDFALSLKLFTETVGSDSNEVAESLYYLGDANCDKGDYKAAQGCLNNCLEIRKKNLGEDNQETLDCRTLLGIVASNLGNLDEALEYYQTVLRADQKAFGDNDPRTATAYYNVGTVYAKRHLFEDATQCYTKALEIRTRILGENHLATADIQYELGSMLIDAGKLDSAIQNLNAALQGYSATVGPSASQTAKALNNLGAAYFQKHDYDHAIKAYQQAFTIKRKLFGDKSLNVARACARLGDVYNEVGELAKAAEFHRFAAQIQMNQSEPDNYEIARLLFNAGNEYSGSGDLKNAAIFYETAIEVITHFYGNDDLVLIDYRINLATVLHNMDQDEKALGQLKLALEENDNHKLCNQTTSYIYSGFGIIYTDEGDLDKGVFYLEKSVKIKQGIPDIDSENLARSYNNLGVLFQKKGDYRKALECHRSALEIRLKLYEDDNINTALSYSQLASAYLNLGEGDKVIESNLAALETVGNLEKAGRCQDENSAMIASQVYSNVGIILDLQKNYSAALDCHTKALALGIKASGEYASDLMKIYDRLGKISEEMGHNDEARQNYEKACDIGDRSTNYLDIIQMTWLEANLVHIPGIQLTERFITTGINAAEKGWFALGSAKIGIMARSLPLYYMGVDLGASNGNVEKAFFYSESLRSRGFLDQLGTETALRLNGVTDDERSRVNDLIGCIGNARSELERLNELPEGKRDSVAVASVGTVLSDAEKKLTALDESISRRLPKYAELRNPRPIDLASARTWCGPSRAVLEYVLWDPSLETAIWGQSEEQGILKTAASKQSDTKLSSYCLILTQGGVEAVKLDGDYDYVKAVNDLRSIIGLARNPGKMEKLRNELYAKLLAPALEKVPAGTSEIVIVPDGPLSSLPFDILRSDKGSADFGTVFTVCLSPSVSVSALRSKEESAASRPSLAFGGGLYDPERKSVSRGFSERGFTRRSTEGAATGIDTGADDDETRGLNIVQLDNAIKEAKEKGAGAYFAARGFKWSDIPGTEQEVKDIGAIAFGDKDIEIMTGKDASEAELKKLSGEGFLKSCDVIHLACHGYFDGFVPEMSSVVLSEVSGLLPDDKEDGYLTVPEVATLNLNARMVSLSACSTGLTNVRRGDGMVGLVRSFLVAGSRNVGVSLWNVDDDATREFMTRVYSKVLKGGLDFPHAYAAVKDEFRKDPKWSHPYYWAAFTTYE